MYSVWECAFIYIYIYIYTINLIREIILSNCENDKTLKRPFCPVLLQ